MIEKKEMGQFYPVIVLAVVALTISVWAFLQGMNGKPDGGITQRNMSGKQINAEGNTVKEQGEIDTEQLAKEVLEKISFDTELTLMEPAVVDSMITTAVENTEVILYMGEGTCADELLIITVQDKENVRSEIESVQQHLSDMQQSFLDYLPKEAKKIDDAVILQTKNYIVACVTSDADHAKEVIEDQLK